MPGRQRILRKNFKGDQQQVAKVIEALETASVKGRNADGKKICTQLVTDALAKTIASQDSQHNCDDQIKASLDDLKVSGGTASLDVVKVSIDGDKAVASVKATTGADKQTSDYSLVRSGKTWRISQF